jgi:hypothetical protein
MTDAPEEELAAPPNTGVAAAPPDPVAVPPTTSWRGHLKSWAMYDSPYILMLLLALIGVMFRLPARYWVILTPIYAVICVVAGWRHFHTSRDQLQLVYLQAVSWGALIFAIYVLYNDVVQGVLNTSATSLAMMTLLALGTLHAGMQARAWRICAVGALLLLAVPFMGWLEQSALLLVGATIAVIAIGFATWWVAQRRQTTIV